MKVFLIKCDNPEILKKENTAEFINSFTFDQCKVLETLYPDKVSCYDAKVFDEILKKKEISLDDYYLLFFDK